MRPWYLRWWGVAIIAYIAVTAALGIIFTIVINRPARQPLGAAAAIRFGNFTANQRAGDESERSPRVGAAIIREDAPALGALPERALLTVVEFSDFQCPFCKQSYPIVREALARYGDRVRLIYRNFPVEELHIDARLAAEAAACAQAQGKFWAYHDKLFQNQEALDPASLFRYARQVGLDQRFDACVAARQFKKVVQDDLDVGLGLGVSGTPTWFFIPNGDEAQARKVEGVIPREEFLRVFEQISAQ